MKRNIISIAILLCSLSLFTSANAQMKVHPDGSVEIHSQTPNWGRAIYTIVQNGQACAYHLCNNYAGNDVFYVCAEGWTWNLQNYYTGSDSSLKYDIKPIASPLQTIKSLTGRQYLYKTDSEKQPHFGFIAQEVEETHPELVKTMNDGKKALSYDNFVAILLEGIKEQQSQIESLQKELDELKEEIQTIKTKEK